MAKKAKPEFNKKLVIDAFNELAAEKKIDRDLLQGILEETLLTLVRKKYGQNADAEIIVNMKEGDIEIYLIKQVVEEVSDPEVEISLEEANLYSKEPLEIGDEFIEEITSENIADNFGRRLILNASQMINQKTRDVERDIVYDKYAKMVGEMIIGEVYQKRRNIMIIRDNDGVEMKLLLDDQLQLDARVQRKGKTICAVVKEVNRTGSTPDILLSRNSETFIKRIFEREVTEVADGTVIIKAIAREPGERIKIALISEIDKIDPVAACVGFKGSRINNITRELGEKIDLIPWNDNMEVMIAKSFAPAVVEGVEVFPETRTATVTVSESQISDAIGSFGTNIRLVSQLTGYSLRVIKEGYDDIEIQEFEEEIGEEQISQLLDNDISTAREFLDASPSILKESGMKYDDIIDIRRIMLLEFEENENDEYLEDLRETFGILIDTEVVSTDEAEVSADTTTEISEKE